MLDDLAVIARPGAASRRIEVGAITAALQPLRRLAYIRPPGDGRVICAREYPRTRRRLEAHGAVTTLVPAGELAKAEGGLTCCSVLVSMA